MANDRNMINAFDDAIERLSNGEDLEKILSDYPDYADHLRDLLLISTRVAEVHNEDDAVVSAQSRGRDKLQQALQEKPKRAPLRPKTNWYLTGAVATVVLIIGAGLLFAVLSSPFTEAYSSDSNVSFSLTATQVINEVTQVAMETTPLLINATASPLPTQVPTLAPFEENFDLTATRMMLPTHTPPSTLVPTVSPFPAQSGIIPTSMASMPTIPPTANEQLPDTGGVEGGIKTTSMPSSPTPVPTQTAQATLPAGTSVADGTLLQTATVMPSIATGLPALIPLTAGEIDDNADWDTYLRYRQEFLARDIPVRDIDVTGRQIITVVDELNRPILGATVQFFAGDSLVYESETYADGRTMFLPNADVDTRDVNVFTVLITKNDFSTQFTLDRTQSNQWLATLPGAYNRENVGLDVLFLIDTTSSMSDEIMQLQNNILHISSEVNNFADVDVRYGLVLYREHDNFEYLTRRYDFTNDIAIFQSNLNTVIANSGDNNPDWDEALNVGLDEALQLMSWREDDTIKLMFLVADARPHFNHPLEPVTYDMSILDALERGIKIHPIASSGLEPAGEYIFRQIAQVTLGHFIFLTYDDGVAGSTGSTRPEFEVGVPESEDPIGGYTVNQLSDIVLKLIQDELSANQLNRP